MCPLSAYVDDLIWCCRLVLNVIIVKVSVSFRQVFTPELHCLEKSGVDAVQVTEAGIGPAPAQRVYSTLTKADKARLDLGQECV